MPLWWPRLTNAIWNCTPGLTHTVPAQREQRQLLPTTRAACAGNFIEYEGQLYFNPSLQENRDHICKVITDIVTRYDVDGLHIDDYFYPYPVNGKPFNDDKWFRSSGYENKALWRRSNVNSLIEQIHKTVRAIKPWVKFGVSPFGIYRNEGSWEWGSRTKGLQSYDDLNADVLYWIDEGWVDYCIPQIYWR